MLSKIKAHYVFKTVDLPSISKVIGWIPSITNKQNKQ
jgi:hypothetical protein